MNSTPPGDSRASWIAVGGCWALILLGGSSSLGHLWERWEDPRGYYSHGPLVLAVAAWLMWTQRQRLRETSPPTWWGLAGLFLSGWLFRVGVLGRSHALAQQSILAGLLCSLCAIRGLRTARLAWFPWLYLALFAVPSPGVVLDQLTLGLKLTATSWAAWTLCEWFGVPLVQDGGTIHLLGGRAVFVDDLCSGLRSMVSLCALAALVGYLQRRKGPALLILAAAVPIAVGSNGLRILFLSVVAARGGDIAEGTWTHDGSGAAVYAVALTLLLALHLVLERFYPPPAESGAPSTNSTPDLLAPDPSPRRDTPVRALALALAASFAVSGLVGAPPPAVSTSAGVLEQLPLEVEDWKCAPLPPDPVLSRVLAGERYLERTYQRADGKGVELFVHDTTSEGVHKPSVCISLQGYRELSRSEVSWNRPCAIQATRTVISRERAPVLVYYWHASQAGHRSDWGSLRTLALLRRALFLSEEERVVTLRLLTSLQDGEAAAEARIQAFLTDVMPHALSQLALP